MKKFKEHNVVMVATDKAENCLYRQCGKLYYFRGYLTQEYLHNSLNAKSFHLYITSDEKIQEGDWVYENNLNQEIKIYQIEKREGRLMFFRFRSIPIWLDKNSHNCKKIIATTNDKISINLGLEKWRSPLGKHADQIYTRLCPFPRIPISFIEHYITEYNKGNIIDKVMVEYEDDLWIQDYANTPTSPLPPMINMGGKLLINSDNIINIKPFKESWNREEVIQLLLNCCGEVSCDDGILLGKTPVELSKWIEQNL